MGANEGSEKGKKGKRKTKGKKESTSERGSFQEESGECWGDEFHRRPLQR